MNGLIVAGLAMLIVVLQLTITAGIAYAVYVIAYILGVPEPYPIVLGVGTFIVGLVK